MAEIFTYAGTVTMYSSRPDFKGPKVVENIGFELHDEGDGLSFKVEAFTPVNIDDVDTPVGRRRLTAKMEPGGKAQFEPGSGKLTIQAKFRFRLDLGIVAPSFLSLTVDTESATMPAGNKEAGTRVTAGAGVVRLVGCDTFKGSILEGDSCGVLLDGALQPSPR